MNKILWGKPPKKLQADRSELHVWQIKYDIEYLYASLISLLSFEEIHDANTFFLKKNYRRYQISHGIKRLILAKYLNTSPKSIIFHCNNYGKPFIAPWQNPCNLQFNLSHSNNLILMAVTIKDNVGIDVEYNENELSENELISDIFSHKEQFFFSNLNDKQEKKLAFYRCWTRKEAYLKANGIGLTVDLKNISVDLNELPVNKWLSLHNVHDALELKTEVQWKLFPINVGKSYTGSIIATSHQKNLISYNAEYLLNR